MASFYQRFQVLLGSKMRVYLKYVLGPVTMVTSLGVLNYRGDPNRVDAQAGDVVEVLLDAFKRSTAVVPQIGALLGWKFPRGSKAICEELKKKIQEIEAVRPIEWTEGRRT